MMRKYDYNGSGRSSIPKTILKVVLRVLAVILVFVLFVVATLAGTIKQILSDTSPTARSKFTTTMLETGQLKFIVHMFQSDKKTQEIVDKTSMKSATDENVDTSMIQIDVPDTSDTDNT
ncbi:MAG: hypothetical protein IJQ80_06735, partial [Clostridia bacterium]|nr:hypothetical protein [Clostridia bacterium]